MKRNFTTEEWNALATSGVSFQIQVEANEGTWVDEPVAPLPDTIATCPDCKYIYPTSRYYYGGANNSSATEVSTLAGVTNDYRTLNKNSFIGFMETQDGKIDRAFACGIKGAAPNANLPYCIEGLTDGSLYASNVEILNNATTGIWQGNCNSQADHMSCHDWNNGSVAVFQNGDVIVYGTESYNNSGSCGVNSGGFILCW